MGLGAGIWRSPVADAARAVFLVVVAPFRSCGRTGDGLGTHLDPLGSSRQFVRNRSGNLDGCSGVLGSNLVSLASVEMTGSQARRATGKPSRGAPEAPTPIREPASAKLARRRAREGADAQYARELERAVMTGLAKKRRWRSASFLERRRADRLRNRQKPAFGVRPAGNGSSKPTPHRRAALPQGRSGWPPAGRASPAETPAGERRL